MFHTEHILDTIRKSAGFYRISDRLYFNIIKAGDLRSASHVSPGIFKLECAEDDVYIEIKQSNGEHFYDVLVQ